MRAFGLITLKALPSFIEAFILLLSESGDLIPEISFRSLAVLELEKNFAKKALLQSSQVKIYPWGSVFSHRWALSTSEKGNKRSLKLSSLTPLILVRPQSLSNSSR